MANNRVQVKRTSVSGRTPNTTGSYATNSQYISAGEFALNMADGILYSSDGTAVIEIGANNSKQFISTNNLTVGSSLYVVANGNVGIGTSSPAYKLDVNGNAKANNLRLDAESTSVAISLWNGAGYYGGFGTEASLTGSGSSTSVGVRADTGRSIIFYSNGNNERARIASNGNIGIRIATPTSDLHVNGTANITSTTTFGGSTIWYQGSNTITATMSSSGILSFVGSSTGQELFSISDSFTGTIYSVTTSGGVPIIEVSNTGNVAIAQYTGILRVGADNTANTLLSVGANTILYSNNIVTGGLSVGITTKTANYTLLQSDQTVLANATSGNITITLPAANTNTGRIYSIKKIDSTSNMITIATTSSQTIDGASTMNLTSQFAVLTVQSDSSNWWII